MADEERPTRLARRRMSEKGERKEKGERREKSEREVKRQEGRMEEAEEPETESRTRDLLDATESDAQSGEHGPCSCEDMAGGGGVQLFGAARWQSPKRTSRQTVGFSMTEPVWLTAAGGGGCCVTDLHFAAPSTVAELSFQNFYAATVDILVLKAAPATGSAAEALLSAFALHDGCVGDSAMTGEQVVTEADAKTAEVAVGKGVGEGEGAPGFEPEAADFLRSLGLDLHPLAASSGTWEVSVRRKQLMPFPHYETGSQDRFSVLAKESACGWTQLVAMRLVLRQPSPSWTVLGVSGVVAFRDRPQSTHSRRRARDNAGGCGVALEGGREGDAEAPSALLAAVRRQTEAALAFGMAEVQRDHPRHPRLQHHSVAYEFFQLPKV